MGGCVVLHTCGEKRAGGRTDGLVGGWVGGWVARKHPPEMEDAWVAGGQAGRAGERRVSEKACGRVRAVEWVMGGGGVAQTDETLGGVCRWADKSRVLNSATRA